MREHVNLYTRVSAPHFTHLSHIKSDGQNLSMTEFHKECTLMDQQITAVKILPNGDVFEVIVAPEHFSVYFAPTCTHPTTAVNPPTSGQCARRTARPRARPHRLVLQHEGTPQQGRLRPVQDEGTGTCYCAVEGGVLPSPRAVHQLLQGAVRGGLL